MSSRAGLIFILLLSVLPHGTVAIRLPQTDGKEQIQGLELTTRIVRQRYCKSSEEGGEDSLRIDLGLRFRNQGRLPVILYKGSDAVIRQLVSRSVQDLAGEKYLLDASLTVDIEGKPDIAGSIAPDKNFVILLPGEVYDSTAPEGAILFLKSVDSGMPNTEIDPGEYWLQVGVITFPYSRSVADALRDRWRSSGVLWSSSVISQGMPLEVMAQPKLETCGVGT